MRVAAENQLAQNLVEAAGATSLSALYKRYGFRGHQYFSDLSRAEVVYTTAEKAGLTPPPDVPVAALLPLSKFLTRDDSKRVQVPQEITKDLKLNLQKLAEENWKPKAAREIAGLPERKRITSETAVQVIGGFIEILLAWHQPPDALAKIIAHADSLIVVVPEKHASLAKAMLANAKNVATGQIPAPDNNAKSHDPAPFKKENEQPAPEPDPNSGAPVVGDWPEFLHPPKYLKKKGILRLAFLGSGNGTDDRKKTLGDKEKGGLGFTYHKTRGAWELSIAEADVAAKLEEVKRAFSKPVTTPEK